MGHSQCGGIEAFLNESKLDSNDFLTSWLSLIKKEKSENKDVNEFSKDAMLCSYENCLTFPWIKEKVIKKELEIHLWFFDIKEGKISTYSFEDKEYQRLTKFNKF